MTEPRWLAYLLPWEFSFAWAFFCLAGAALYLRGLRQRRRQEQPVGVGRPLAFLVGIAAIYVVTQTHYDYLAQYMFFTHRAQHLVLHHAAPFLIALAAPLTVLAAGMPRWLAIPVRTAALALMPFYRLVQHPLVAPLLFVGLIYFWLMPEVHFDAMLSYELYQIMNWTMLLDGLLFWWLVLDSRAPNEGGLGYGWRIVLLLMVVPPQIALGAYITLADDVLFDVYAVCGRAWPLAPLTDQQLGGLITWIPASMMSVLGVLVVLRRLLKGHDDKSSLAMENRDAAV